MLELGSNGIKFVEVWKKFENRNDTRISTGFNLDTVIEPLKSSVRIREMLSMDGFGFEFESLREVCLYSSL